MISLHPETYTTDVRVLPIRQQEPLIAAVNTTVGATFGRGFYVLGGCFGLIEPALRTIRATKDKALAKQALEFLPRIASVMERMNSAMFVSEGFSPLQAFNIRATAFMSENLPPLRAFNVEDGSLLIEWIFGDFRIGFTFESDSKDSGWYLVSNANLGQISASGYLSGMSYTMLAWLLGFVINHS